MTLPKFVKPLDHRAYVLNSEQWNQMLGVAKVFNDRVVGTPEEIAQKLRRSHSDEETASAA